MLAMPYNTERILRDTKFIIHPYASLISSRKFAMFFPSRGRWPSDKVRKETSRDQTLHLYQQALAEMETQFSSTLSAARAQASNSSTEERKVEGESKRRGIRIEDLLNPQ